MIAKNGPCGYGPRSRLLREVAAVLGIPFSLHKAAPLIWGLVSACVMTPATAQGGMVDTVQYGQIQIGMKEKEVRERLGPPDRVKESWRHRTKSGSTRRGPGWVRTKSLVYVGTNPASGQKITTTIFIQGGVVIDKKRSYH